MLRERKTTARRPFQKNVKHPPLWEERVFSKKGGGWSFKKEEGLLVLFSKKRSPPRGTQKNFFGGF